MQVHVILVVGAFDNQKRSLGTEEVVDPLFHDTICRDDGHVDFLGLFT